MNFRKKVTNFKIKFEFFRIIFIKEILNNDYVLDANVINFNNQTNQPLGAGEMVPQLGDLAALPEDLSSSLRTHRDLQPSVSPTPGDPLPSLASMGTSMHIIHRHTWQAKHPQILKFPDHKPEMTCRS